MSISILLALAALAASIFLMVRSQARAWAVPAAIASGVQVAMAFGWMSLRIANLPLHLVIALVIAVCGGVCFTRVSAKGHVAAATVLAFVGILRVVAALS